MSDDVPGVLSHKTPNGDVQYIMGEKIGAGGFSTVYGAEQVPGGAAIAVKCISKARLENKKVHEKLITEIQIHRSLSHPNVLRFYTVLQDPNFVYILLERMANGTVLERLKREKRFDEEEAAQILRDVLHGLHYCHEQRVIHRDLKLQNLLVDEAGVVKIGDFGLAAQLTDDDVKRMTVCGTPGFVSPEVLAHQDGQSPAVDIWGVGVCAFVMLTGRQPFVAKDRAVTYRRIREATYEWPADCRVSALARSFVGDALSRDARERPSAAQLLQHGFIERVRACGVAVPIVEFPAWSVRIWWDASHRAGIGYLLRNGVCGAYFNDDSRLVMRGDRVEYFPTWQGPPEDAKGHRHKMWLLRTFSRELRRRVGSDGQFEPDSGLDEPICHVKYWARNANKDTVFRMTDRSIQANFVDHVKICLEVETRRIWYRDAQGVRVFSYDDLRDRTRFAEERRRVHIISVISKDLTTRKGGTVTTGLRASIG